MNQYSLKMRGKCSLQQQKQQQEEEDKHNQNGVRCQAARYAKAFTLYKFLCREIERKRGSGGRKGRQGNN